MTDTNGTIKNYAHSHGVHLYEVAKKLGIAEFTFCRRLRNELPEEEQHRIKGIIDEIAAEKWS